MPKEYRSDKRLVSQKRKREVIWRAMNTLLKDYPLGEISIQMICDLAGVHRTTFYNHFYDVYDLIGYGTEHIIQNAIEQMEKPEETTAAGLETLLFDFVCRNRDVIMNIHDSVYQAGILDALQKVIEAQLQDQKWIMDSMDQKDMKSLYSRFVSYGFAGLVFTWIRSENMDDEKLKEEVHNSIAAFGGNLLEKA